MSLREIKCGKCGSAVKIPFFWVLGIEGVFYCRQCKQHFKLNYKFGAVLTAVGWTLAMVTMQLLAFFTSAVTLTIAVIAFFPLAVFYSFLLRRFFLKRRRKQ